jgi:hypothetical protein
MMHRGLIVAIAFPLLGAAVFVFAAVGGDPPAKDEGPCVVIWRYGGNSLKPNAGLEFAAWNDGTILFSPSPRQLGEHLVAGRVEPGDLAAALVAIRAADFFAKHRDMLVPDSSYTVLMVRDGAQQAVHGWHEYLLPGFGGDLNSDADYRAFVRMWKKTRGALTALAPIEMHTLADRLEGRSDFRGYAPSAPEKTLWRPG